MDKMELILSIKYHLPALQTLLLIIFFTIKEITHFLLFYFTVLITRSINGWESSC